MNVPNYETALDILLFLRPSALDLVDMGVAKLGVFYLVGACSVEASGTVLCNSDLT